MNQEQIVMAERRSAAGFGALQALAAACLVALALPAAADSPVFGTSGTAEPVAVGASLAVDFTIAGIVDLYAWQFSLLFDPAVLQVSSVTAGSFLSSAGPTIFSPGTIDNVAGRIGFVLETQQGPGAGVGGSGVLAQVGFAVVGLGASPLSSANVVFLDGFLQDIPVTVDFGTVTAVPEPASMLLMALGVAGLLAARRRT
jgi:hypothetical protein